MEPLQGWESFPGSPAPQPDILRLALYFLLLVPCHFTLSLPLCKEEEYPVGTECCPKCSPAMGLETRQKCSTIKDTECGCPRDHLCVREDTDPCAMCQPLETKGSEKKDTGCNNCPPGTFSPLETLEECQPSTNCSGWLETETRPGTCTTEGACFSWLSLILGLSIPCVIIFGLVIWYLKKQKRPSGGLAKRMSFFQRWIRRDAERDTTVSEALQVGLDVTTVAVEETVREDTASCLTPQDLDMEIGLESRG
ncbi:tumor necrosis factor receptor superfamily member 14 isoform 3-T3 [Trichechus inunguis]|uniref:Tumor necrosis factor receptor superfamily member 14 isoform X2 n=1 Tax=Trichechus manatus latirostris TaxID=127582 RepID=A0A2Y9RS83_TRIMA|nr:tumor necrosis factor receptor superfamily member 14 isoform X2 [Trichechus manatus latirostris]